MMTNEAVIRGVLVGSRTAEDGTAVALIVQNAKEAAGGAAESAFVLIDMTNERPRARYISWINIFDIEHAASCQPGWQLVEPPLPYAGEVEWRPYGWGGPSLPSVADR